MNNLYRTVLLFLSLVIPALVNAQTSVITYRGSVMTGESTIITAAPTIPGYDPSCVYGICQTFATPSTAASFDAQIAYTGSVAQNNLRIVNATVNFTGNNGSTFQHLNLTDYGVTGSIIYPETPFDNGFNSDPYPTSEGGWCFSSSSSLEGCVSLTISGQVVTGATFNFYTEYVSQGQGSINYQLGIDAGGDSFSWTEGEFDPCGSKAGYGGDIYVGPTTVPGFAPCLIDVANSTPGFWTPATIIIDENFDELNPQAMAVSAGTFTSASGSVDISSSTAVCIPPALGNCLNLNGGDGATQGSIQSSAIRLVPGVNYYLSFDLIDPNGASTTSTTVSIGPYSHTFAYGGLVANQLIAVTTPTVTKLVFTSNAPIGGSGAILDKVLLASVPVPFEAPRIAYGIEGILGAQGWYVSLPTIAWTVAGVPAPNETGCDSVTVPNTKGKKYTCKAKNSQGSATESVTVKVDKTPPVVAVSLPGKAAAYKLNQTVVANYACSDAISGVESCVGSVANGASIATSSIGPQVFTVTGTDVAGNQTIKTVHYRVVK